jgi:hypothetical protein
MIRFARLAFHEACAHLAPMVGNPKWDYSGGLFGVLDIIGGGVVYIASDDSGPLMVVALEQVKHEGGRELVIRAALQLTAAGDATERVLPEIERVFGVGCDAVTVYTMRAGLIRKMQASGYTDAASIMRKKL